MAVLISADAEILGTRICVRNSAGNIYVVLKDSEFVEMWKSSDGGQTWFEQDVANRPVAGVTVRFAVAAIDGNDKIHVFYGDDALGYARYVIFDTSTDTWGTPENVGPLEAFDGGAAITIDSNNKPHVVWERLVAYHGVTYRQLYYSNKVGATWLAPEKVNVAPDKNHKWPQITVDSVGAIHVCYGQATDDELLYRKRDGTWGTETLVDSDCEGEVATSIAINANGNVLIAYYAPTAGAVKLATYTTSWSTEIVRSIDVGDYVSLAINGTDRYVFYRDLVNGYIHLSKNIGVCWVHETLEADVYDKVSSKWSFYYNNQGEIQIDYVFSYISNIYWNKYILIPPPVAGAQIINA